MGRLDDMGRLGHRAGAHVLLLPLDEIQAGATAGAMDGARLDFSKRTKVHITIVIQRACGTLSTGPCHYYSNVHFLSFAA